MDPKLFYLNYEKPLEAAITKVSGIFSKGSAVQSSITQSN